MHIRQGLAFSPDGRLFESCGLYGTSSLRELDPATMTVLRSVAVAPKYFGAGVSGRVWWLLAVLRCGCGVAVLRCACGVAVLRCVCGVALGRRPVVFEVNCTSACCDA